MITVTASAHCLRCDWSVSGEWAATDRAAERHTRTAKHPTGVMAGASHHDHPATGIESPSGGGSSAYATPAWRAYIFREKSCHVF